MNKTKFGLSANAYAALVFAVGLLGITPVVLLAGAALIVEENEWLKRMSVKALAFVAIMKIFSVILLLLPDALGMIVDILLIADVDVSIITSINSVFGVLNDGLLIFTNVMLILYAYQAYCGKYAKVLFVEGMVNKNM